MQYGIKPNDRLFTVTKSYLHHEMDRGAKAAGVKRIRIHDLRHSHVSLLIEMGLGWATRVSRLLIATLISSRRSRTRWRTSWILKGWVKCNDG